MIKIMYQKSSQIIFQLIDFLINSVPMKLLAKSIQQSFAKVKPSVQELFQSRNLFYQITSQELTKKQFNQKIVNKAVYCGYDPTSDSLHLGNLVSIIMMGRLSLLGLRPIFLVGGATGLIGDPSGKVKERTLLEHSVVLNNIDALKTEISTVYENVQRQMKLNRQEYELSQEQLALTEKSSFKMVNNYSFYEHMNAITFLRQVGKLFRMGPLMSRQAVSQRLKSEDGISYAQFSYSIIQAYDFLNLFRNEECVLQFGGSDQWGNIVNGCDLVKKMTEKEVYGITMPLLLTKSGQKFGKSQGNALFLNPKKTSSELIFNYFFNTSDEDVQKYLKIFTFYPEQKISSIMTQHTANKEKKIAQNILTESVLRLIRPGESVSKQRQFFTLSHEELLKKEKQFFDDLFSRMERDKNQYYRVSEEEIRQYPSMADFLVKRKLVKSKSQIRRQIEKGGLYLNNKRVEMNDFDQPLQKIISNNIIFNEFMLIRWGKKRYQFIHKKK